MGVFYQSLLVCLLLSITRWPSSTVSQHLLGQLYPTYKYESCVSSFLCVLQTEFLVVVDLKNANMWNAYPYRQQCSPMRFSNKCNYHILFFSLQKPSSNIPVKNCILSWSGALDWKLCFLCSRKCLQHVLSPGGFFLHLWIWSTSGDPVPDKHYHLFIWVLLFLMNRGKWVSSQLRCPYKSAALNQESEIHTIFFRICI